MIASGLLLLSLSAGSVVSDAPTCPQSSDPEATRIVSVITGVGTNDSLAGIDGVPVDAVIGEDGKPRRIAAIDVEGLPSRVERSAEKAVRQWEFKPAMECGRAVARDVVLIVSLVERKFDTSHQPIVLGPKPGPRTGQVPWQPIDRQPVSLKSSP